MAKKQVKKGEEVKKFKKGAASFYVVAISTLILVIIAASFAALIVSEVTRTSNDDLSQSAYDAALAGTEDAKLAFMNYQECRTDPSKHFGKNNISCAQLMEWVDNGTGGCDMVALALGRDVVGQDGNTVSSIDDPKAMGVLVQEGTDNEGNQMNQYYTCTKISTQTDDYLGTLTTDDTEHSVTIRFREDGASGGNVYNDVNKIRVSWHSFGDNTEKGSAGQWFSWMQPNGTSTLGTNKVTPAVMAVTVVQTGDPFNLSDFDRTIGDQTNRGTLYLVPTNNENASAGQTYESAVSGGNNYIPASALLKSNDKEISNKPYLVWCDETGSQDYACEVDIEIPKPIGGTRNKDTFVVSVASIFGEPKTDYRLEFFSNSTSTPLTLDGVQISLDSTGRANDLFRRVDTRLEASDAAYPYPFLSLESLGTGGGDGSGGGIDGSGVGGIDKQLITTCEWNFDDLTCQ